MCLLIETIPEVNQNHVSISISIYTTEKACTCDLYVIIMDIVAHKLWVHCIHMRICLSRIFTSIRARRHRGTPHCIITTLLHHSTTRTLRIQLNGSRPIAAIVLQYNERLTSSILRLSPVEISSAVNSVTRRKTKNARLPRKQVLSDNSTLGVYKCTY